MSKVNTTQEIDTIRNVIENFGWTLVKQEITSTEITLTIQKVISATDVNSADKAE